MSDTLAAPTASPETPARPKRFAVITWGCQMNVDDSDQIENLLLEDGLVKADGIEDADVVMLILTDGLENSSKQYSPTAIKTLMETCERSGKWNFLFLGAGLEVTEVTNAYARGDRNAMSFSKDNFAASFKEVNKELEDYVKQKEQNIKKSKFFKD